MKRIEWLVILAFGSALYITSAQQGFAKSEPKDIRASHTAASEPANPDYVPPRPEFNQSGDSHRDERHHGYNSSRSGDERRMNRDARSPANGNFRADDDEKQRSSMYGRGRGHGGNQRSAMYGRGRGHGGNQRGGMYDQTDDAGNPAGSMDNMTGYQDTYTEYQGQDDYSDSFSYDDSGYDHTNSSYRTPSSRINEGFSFLDSLKPNQQEFERQSGLQNLGY